MDFEKIKNEVKFVAVRSRGPGGQNVNKVSSAAVLYWSYTFSPALTDAQKYLIRTKLESVINKEEQVFVRSDEFRDLVRNKDRCLEKLRGLLTSAFHKPKKRKATRPTRASKERKLDGKSHRGDIKKSRSKNWD